MPDVEWIYRDKSGAVTRTLEPAALPSLGDGKFYNNKGYQVVVVVQKRQSVPYDLVIAYES